MKCGILNWWFRVCLAALFVGVVGIRADTRVESSGGGYRLLRDGEAMVVRGVLTGDDFVQVARLGANAVLLPDARWVRETDPAHGLVADLGPMEQAGGVGAVAGGLFKVVDLAGGSAGCTVTNPAEAFAKAGWAGPFVLIGNGRPGPLPEKRASWGALVDHETGGGGWIG